MKYLSLFTGIGGFELGIQNAYLHTVKREESRKSQQSLSDNGEQFVGMEQPSCIGYSEIDKYAVQIYQSHFPQHKNYGDITKINEAELPDFDLLCGGFPCQSFSIAGKRGGFSDTRGTLFFDIARLLKAKQPRLLLLENVKGLLSHDEGRTFATIISTLDELGYDCQWQVLNSKDFGVPQNRERVFIVGHLRGTSRPQVFPLEGNASKDYAGTLEATYSKGGHTGTYPVTAGTLRTHKDGNGFREVQSGLAPTLPARAREDGSGQGVVMIPEATKQGYAIAKEGDSINLSVPGSATRRGRVGKGIAQTLDTGMQQYTLSKTVRSGGRASPHGSKQNWDSYEFGGQIRRLTPTECERLQGFPDGWTAVVSDTQRYKTLGNAVTVNVIEAVVSRMI